MKRNILIVLAIVIFLATITLIFIEGGFKEGDFEIVSNDITLEQTKLKVPKADLNIKYDANAVLSSISRNEFILTLFLSGLSDNSFQDLSENNIYAYIVDKDNQIFGEINVIPYSKSGSKIASSLVLDYSGSMEYHIKFLEEAVKAYIDNFKDGDMAEIIKFGSDIQDVLNFSSDKNTLYNSINKDSQLRSGTALYDAIYRGLEHSERINKADFCNAAIAFTDGGDNESKVTVQSVIDYAVQSQIPVFTVGLQSSDYSPDILSQIAKNTGGFFYQTSDPSQLKDLYNKINLSLRNSYLLKIKWDSDELPESGSNVNFYIRIMDNNQAITEYHKSITLP